MDIASLKRVRGFTKEEWEEIKAYLQSLEAKSPQPLTRKQIDEIVQRELQKKKKDMRTARSERDNNRNRMVIKAENYSAMENDWRDPSQSDLVIDHETYEKYVVDGEAHLSVITIKDYVVKTKEKLVPGGKIIQSVTRIKEHPGR